MVPISCVEDTKVAARSVLVVDDSPIFRHAVCDLFSREEGFEVCAEADNGLDAIDKAKHYQPDLIVTGLFMPQMNGLEETRLLRKLMPKVPVIVHSIHIDAEIEREAMAAVASVFISKFDTARNLIPTARDLLEDSAE